MKHTIIIILLSLILGVIVGYYINNNNDRYSVVNGKFTTILLDKKTGLVWNIRLNDIIPIYWGGNMVDHRPIGYENDDVQIDQEKLNEALEKQLNE